MINPVLETIALRDSCRTFTAEPVARDALEALALAGVSAPSSRGNAPWKIVVVTDPSLIADISDSAMRLLARREPSARARFEKLGANVFYNAPVVFVLAVRHIWDFTDEQLDIGLVTENIALAATSMGLGSLICGFGTQAFRDLRSPDPARLVSRLGLPCEYEVAITIGVGHRGEPSTPHTPDLSAVTYR